MDVIIHFTDLDEFLGELRHQHPIVFEDTLRATTLTERGMPEFHATVEAAFLSDGDLYRFRQYVGSWMPGGEAYQKVEAAVTALHDQIRQCCADLDVVVRPGRVFLAPELDRKGGGS